MALGLGDKRVEGVAKRAEPQTVVDHLRPLLRDRVLEPRHLFRERDVLQRLVSLKKQHRGRSFVDLARLDADEAVLQVIDAADSVLAADPVEGRHQLQRIDGLAIERDRQAFLESDLHVRRLVGAVSRVARPGVDVARWLGPRVLQHACLDRASPQVLVRRVGRPHRGGHLDSMLRRVLDLVVAVHAPFTDGCDDLEVRRERCGRDVEPHLVVALARAAVRDRGRTLAPGDLDHHGGDQRAAQRGRERVLLLIDGSRLQRRPHKQLQEWRPAIGDIRRRRAGLQCSRLDRVEVLLLAEVDGERDHVPPEVPQPTNRNRRVEAPGIGEDQLLLAPLPRQGEGWGGWRCLFVSRHARAAPSANGPLRAGAAPRGSCRRRRPYPQSRTDPIRRCAWRRGSPFPAGS